MNEHELVKRCIEGDPSAWDSLVDRYGRLVYSIPRKFGLSETDADDVFQVVFGIVLRRLETLRDVERLSAWLIRTTYREVWRLRRRRGADNVDLPDQLADEGEPTAETVERIEQQDMVRQALGLIDPRCRELLWALFFEVPTPAYEDLAKRLGTRVGSIGPTRARCFSKLEAALQRLGFSEDMI